MFRQFTAGHEPHAREVTRRTSALVGDRDGVLVIAGCGDLPDSHAELATSFSCVVCLDISKVALAIAKEKLRPDAEFRLESIVECDLPTAFADVVYCSHVLYHIGRSDQERAVRQMLRITRPGGRVAILYANPRSIFTLPGEILRRLRRVAGRSGGQAPVLYFHAHPLGWWKRFRDGATIRFEPWEVIVSRLARAILPNPLLSRTFYAAAGRFERALPDAAARLWHFYTVVLDRT